MKLLAFYPYIPYPPNRGAYHRGLNLIRELARDHEIHLLAMAERGEGMEHRDVFKSFCRKVEFVPFEHPEWQKLLAGRLTNPLPATIAHWTVSAMPPMLDRWIEEEEFDAVHVGDLPLTQYFLGPSCNVPLLLDRTRVDLQYQMMEARQMASSLKQRLLDGENRLKLWFYERKVAERCAAQVVCGEDDAAFVRSYISRRVPILVLPNGVDTAFFNPATVPGARTPGPSLIFCGAMDYNPNVDALRWYFSEIHATVAARFPGLTLFIVGKAPGMEVQAYARKPGVVVTGAVADVRPFYKQAWLQIVPLRIGGGTRLKIVESMAMGTPVVTTTIGAQGLDLADGRDVLFADDAGQFAARVIEGLCDAALRLRLETEAAATATDRLGWGTLGRRLNEFYRQLLTSGERGADQRGPATRQTSKSENTTPAR